MNSPAFRRISRLFAAALLLWTAADLFDHHLCVHDHERVGVFGETAFRAPSHDEAPVQEGCDDCFCCSRVIDVGRRFDLTTVEPVTWLVPDAPALAGERALSPLYHPPLA